MNDQRPPNAGPSSVWRSNGCLFPDEQRAGTRLPEPPVDLTGVTGALRRGRRLVVAIVVVVTGVALAVSLLSPDRYRASARIAEDPSATAQFDVDAADRRLATSRELVTAPTVLTVAAAQVPGESR